jgi:multidrug efflux pump subunit AcrA (membrane-fusion protein)
MMSRSALNPGLKTPAAEFRMPALAAFAVVIATFGILAAWAARAPLAAIAQGQIGDNLMITAQVSPLDVDSVTAGQKAKIRFTSFSSRRVPTAFGRIETVSADLIYNESSQQSYYLARVAVDPASLPSSIATRLLPGMPAEILSKGNRQAHRHGPRRFPRRCPHQGMCEK